MLREEPGKLDDEFLPFVFIACVHKRMMNECKNERKERQRVKERKKGEKIEIKE